MLNRNVQIIITEKDQDLVVHQDVIVILHLTEETVMGGDQVVEREIGGEGQDLAVERETGIDGEGQGHVVLIEEVAIVLLQGSTEDHHLQDTGEELNKILQFV